jgi:general secretion pathway protein E
VRTVPIQDRIGHANCTMGIATAGMLELWSGVTALDGKPKRRSGTMARRAPHFVRGQLNGEFRPSSDAVSSAARGKFARLMQQQPYLEIRSDAGRQQVVLGRDPVTVGRHPENQIVVNDKLASRFHCVIEQTAEGFLLRDLGASNPTLVNGRPIKSVLLRTGDVVRVGLSELVVVLPDERRDGGVALEDLAAIAVPSGEGDDEELEELTESDVVDDDLNSIPIPSDVDAPQQETANALHDLRMLAEQAPTKPFGETEIALLNARGIVVHPAGPSPGVGASRETVDLLRLVLLVSFRGRASDIHLEPKGESQQVRIRIDGVLIDGARLANEGATRLASLIKILCEIDPAQRSSVQEGHFVAMVPARGPGATEFAQGGARRVDFRVSFVPTVYGQKMVTRVLDPAGGPVRVADLKLPVAAEKELLRAVRGDSGMVLVCGPTGSGKTTTLYSLIRSLDLRQRNVVTIEDPVEIQIQGVTQLPVDEEHGKTFGALLRSVLRQDPDVLLVGEIRDAETAKIAMQAAITGHLVFSTIHTKDTLGTIYRLLDLGVEPYMLSQGLQVALSQRLVRLLCPYCKRPQKLRPEVVARMGPIAAGVTQVFAARGCHKCFHTGYSGRRAVYEFLNTSEKFRDLLIKGAPIDELRLAMAESGFQSLETSGLNLLAEGVASHEEVERVVG